VNIIFNTTMWPVHCVACCNYICLAFFRLRRASFCPVRRLQKVEDTPRKKLPFGNGPVTKCAAPITVIELFHYKKLDHINQKVRSPTTNRFCAHYKSPKIVVEIWPGH